MATTLEMMKTVLLLQYLQNTGKHQGTSKANPLRPLSFENVLSRSMEGSATGQPNPPAALPPPATVGPSDEEAKFQKSFDFVLRKEGTRFVKEDGGRGSSRYGILQSTARAFGYKGDIRNITEAQVEGIYRKIWERSGAAALPYPLCVVHFDSYVNNPASAKRMLESSQGDIDTYLRMREQRYVRLAKARPELYAKYLNGWKNRVNSLRAVVNEHSRDVMLARSDFMLVNRG